MTVSFHGMDHPIVQREVKMTVVTGHDGGNHPIHEVITFYFMSDGTVRWCR